jgi:hypothetical protein
MHMAVEARVSVNFLEPLRIVDGVLLIRNLARCPRLVHGPAHVVVYRIGQSRVKATVQASNLQFEFRHRKWHFRNKRTPIRCRKIVKSLPEPRGETPKLG